MDNVLNNMDTAFGEKVVQEYCQNQASALSLPKPQTPIFGSVKFEDFFSDVKAGQEIVKRKIAFDLSNEVSESIFVGRCSPCGAFF